MTPLVLKGDAIVAYGDEGNGLEIKMAVTNASIYGGNLASHPQWSDSIHLAIVSNSFVRRTAVTTRCTSAARFRR